MPWYMSTILDSGSGPVFACFECRVRVLPCQVSGFCHRVSILSMAAALETKSLDGKLDRFPASQVEY